MQRLLESLRTLASRSREQAETVTDPEAAKALRDVAADMEGIASFFEDNRSFWEERLK